MATNIGFASPQAEEDYIRQRAAALGLDPEAVLAVAAHEGITLPGEVGDKGTSFGPWQLHEGGRLPAIYANHPEQARAWADSQAGIDYALQGIAGVARGLRGTDAVTAIVYKFEQPANPGNEAMKAVESYQAGQGPSLTGKPPPNTGGVGMVGPHTPVGAAAKDFWAGVQSPLDAVKKIFQFLTSWRAAEVVGGFLLLLVGLYLLGRQFGLNPPTPPAARAVEAAGPAAAA